MSILKNMPREETPAEIWAGIVERVENDNMASQHDHLEYISVKIKDLSLEVDSKEEVPKIDFGAFKEKKDTFKADIARQGAIVGTLATIAPSIKIVSVWQPHYEFKQEWDEDADRWIEQGKLTEPVWNVRRLYLDVSRINAQMQNEISVLKDNFIKKSREHYQGTIDNISQNNIVIR